jgi:lauroyl/myristoyl acyltransferase
VPDTSDLESAFSGPAQIQPLLPLLRKIPAGAAGRLMGAAAVAQGVVRDRRLARAVRWARAQGFSGPARYRVALATLANHGRYVAQEAMLGIASAGELQAASTIIGGEHLVSAGGGLLVGMHIGPPRSWLYLRAHGHRVRVVIRETAGQGAAWDRLRDDEVVVPLSLTDPARRVQSLYRIRRLLADGALVFLTADGPLGATQFTLEVPGAAPAIRVGWFSLRRTLKVPAFPLFIHEEGERRIVTVHPALPPPDPDAARDAEICRSRLTTLVGDYVRQYPTQCRYLAFPPWR